MVGILLSYWGGLFSGAMLVSGRVTYFHCYQMQARAVTPLSEKRPFFDLPDDADAEKHRAWAEQLWCRMDRDRSGTVTREELMCD